jgi:hypothetical protein
MKLPRRQFLADFPLKADEEDDPAVLLDLDYWVLMPR